MNDNSILENPPEIDFSKPVIRPKKGALKLIGEVLNHGGPGYLQFAITNICNADCGFCGFARSKFDPKARRSVTLQEARDVIDIAVKNHIGYLLFVGGEPMVHRDLRAMTRYAAERGIHPMICTNGGLWNDENMRGLASDGLTSVIMSITGATPFSGTSDQTLAVAYVSAFILVFFVSFTDPLYWCSRAPTITLLSRLRCSH